MRKSLRLFVFFSLGLLCFIHNASGQVIIKITGSVLDANTQNPVVGAKLKVKGTSKEITSNDQGLFVIYVPETFKNSLLEVSHSGYKETDFSISEYSGKDVIIYLEKDNISPELLSFRNHLKDKLLELQGNLHHERLFLHTDRNRYISGDNIYFKAYVTEGLKGTPSLLSRSFHVILVDSSGNTLEKVRFPLESGTGNGNLTIPETVKQGSYRLIAYSGFMQNFNPEECFSQSIRIVDKIRFIEGSNTSVKGDSITFADQQNLNVDFLPEGGNLIAGIQNNLGFCAVTDKGKPIKITLLLSDDYNNALDTIHTNHAGLGKFEFTPLRNRKYYASIMDTVSYGTKTFVLPEALEEGIGIIVSRNKKDHLSLKLTSTSKQPEQLRILLVQNSEILRLEKIEIVSIVNHVLKYDNTRTGIATLTILRGEEPIAERLVFLDSEHRLDIEDDLQYGAYSAREKMKLNVRITDQSGNPVKAYLSASIVDSINCISDKHFLKDIRYSFWLRSNMKMHTPASVPMSILNRIGRSDSDLLSDIDLLLLTYGWRKYNKVVEDKTLVNYDHIRGKVIPVNKRRENKTAPELVIYEPTTAYVEIIYPDNNGRFEFIPETSLFDKSLILNFRNSKMGRKWKIILDSYENPSYLAGAGSLKTMDPVAKASDTEIEPVELFDQGVLEKLIHIPEVTVRESMADRTDERTRLANSFRNVGSSGSVTSEDIKDLPDLESIIRRIRPPSKIIRTHPTMGNPVFWIYFRNPDAWGLRGAAPKALFVVNDVPIDPESSGLEVKSIKPEMIDEVSIVPGPQAFTFFGEAALGGAVMIYTRAPEEGYFTGKTDPGLQILPPLSNTRKEFYKPDYNAEDIDPDRADYRLTHHWEPEIVTDNNGEATIEYYNAGYNSYVTGIIQGMSLTGEPVYHRIRYIVIKE